MENGKSCSCCGAPTIIFPCSGGSDVGEVADRTARRLTAEGSGKMYCLAGIGGRVSGIMATTESAESILAIDGCPLDCVKKTLEEAGIKNFMHIRLDELGLKKSESPATEENIAKAADKAKKMLGSCS